jgi:hypothetical protein
MLEKKSRRTLRNVTRNGRWDNEIAALDESPARGGVIIPARSLFPRNIAPLFLSSSFRARNKVPTLRVARTQGARGVLDARAGP